MQGQRGAIGSLPETLNFDHGSASSNAAIDQQICWNNMQNPAENRLPDFILSADDTNVTYVNSINHEQQNLSGWSLGEPSSSHTQNEGCDELKTEHRWAPSVSACVGSGPRLEEPQYEHNDILSLDNVNMNPLFLQSSNSDSIRQNLNLNAGFVGLGGDNCQLMECPNLCKSNGLENERIQPSSGSDPFLLPSGSGGYIVEENDGRPGCSLEGRRVSCKRKALEGNVGQSSVGGSCSYLQRTESSAWPAAPTCYDAGSSLSAPSQQVNPKLGLGVRRVASEGLPDSSMSGSAESSQRNFRLRINPPNQQDSIPPTLFSTGNSVRHSSVSSSRLLPVDHSLGLRSAPATDNTNPQSQSVLIHVPNPALPRNVQPFRWNGGSSSRTGSSSSSGISGDRDAVSREEASSRSMARNILEHPLFVPATELRNVVRNPTNRSLTSGSISIPGNVASTSRASSNSGVRPSSASNWVPPHNAPSQYPWRLSEYVRRSLFSSVGSESGGQSSNYSPLHSVPPASSQDLVLSSGDGQSFPRSASWMERQGDGVLGVPYPLRTLAAASEGRGRLVSEIRNVLGLMRRGEGLPFEDVMILDQSVIFGVADIHDRHRDMRLDVDNMSYEELLALEERIGNVSTGLSEEIILNRMKQRKFSIPLWCQLEAEPCCICQEEYNDGEDLGTLDCGHDFHAKCIKQWLMHKNLCPICKTTALVT